MIVLFTSSVCLSVCLQKSTGRISTSHFYDMNIENDRIVEANADIRNATDFNVDIKIFGFKGIDREIFGGYRGETKLIQMRSFAIICEAFSTLREQDKRTLEYGNRTDADFLVRFERYKAINRATQFPSHTFNFFNPYVNINYVKLTIDVSGV